LARTASLSEQDTLKEDTVSRLVALGLTSQPAKVLLALLENPGIPASKICENTGIPDSKIYQALEDLDKKWNLIEVRKGNPSLYRALTPDQIVRNLKQRTEKEHANRLQRLNELRKRIEPFAKAQAESGELEIAYIVKGQQNILSRLKTMVEQAEKQVLLLTYEPGILRAVLPSIDSARKKRIQVKLAVSEDLEKDLERFGSEKDLVCKCNLLLVDDSKLVSVSNWHTDKSHALVTEDDAMITVAREYYDNPKCCC